MEKLAKRDFRSIYLQLQKQKTQKYEGNDYQNLEEMVRSGNRRTSNESRLQRSGNRNTQGRETIRPIAYAGMIGNLSVRPI